MNDSLPCSYNFNIVNDICNVTLAMLGCSGDKGPCYLPGEKPVHSFIAALDREPTPVVEKLYRVFRYPANMIVAGMAGRYLEENRMDEFNSTVEDAYRNNPYLRNIYSIPAYDYFGKNFLFTRLVEMLALLEKDLKAGRVDCSRLAEYMSPGFFHYYVYCLAAAGRFAEAEKVASDFCAQYPDAWNVYAYAGMGSCFSRFPQNGLVFFEKEITRQLLSESLYRRYAINLFLCGNYSKAGAILEGHSIPFHLLLSPLLYYYMSGIAVRPDAENLKEFMKLGGDAAKTIAVKGSYYYYATMMQYHCCFKDFAAAVELCEEWMRTSQESPAGLVFELVYWSLRNGSREIPVHLLDAAAAKAGFTPLYLPLWLGAACALAGDMENAGKLLWKFYDHSPRFIVRGPAINLMALGIIALKSGEPGLAQACLSFIKDKDPGFLEGGCGDLMTALIDTQGPSEKIALPPFPLPFPSAGVLRHEKSMRVE